MPQIQAPAQQTQGLRDPIITLNPRNLINNHYAPGGNQHAEQATIFVQTKDATGANINSAWINAGKVAGQDVWLNVGGGAGTFTSLTVNPGDITATAGNIIATAGNLEAPAGTVTAESATFNPGPVTVTNGVHQSSVLANSSLAIQNLSSNGTGAVAPLIALSQAHTGDTISHANDVLGVIDFQGSDGAVAQVSASILAIATGTPAVGYVAGQLEFLTAPDGMASAPINRMQIASTGDVTINAPDSGVALTVTGSVIGTTSIAGATLYSTGDLGGIVATTGISNVTNTSQSTGTLAVKSTTANPGNNAGFIKVYIGTVTAYVPYFTNIAP